MYILTFLSSKYKPVVMSAGVFDIAVKYKTGLLENASGRLGSNDIFRLRADATIRILPINDKQPAVGTKNPLDFNRETILVLNLKQRVTHQYDIYRSVSQTSTAQFLNITPQGLDVKKCGSYSLVFDFLRHVLQHIHC